MSEGSGSCMHPVHPVYFGLLPAPGAQRYAQVQSLHLAQKGSGLTDVRMLGSFWGLVQKTSCLQAQTSPSFPSFAEAVIPLPNMCAALRSFRTKLHSMPALGLQIVPDCTCARVGMLGGANL